MSTSHLMARLLLRVLAGVILYGITTKALSPFFEASLDHVNEASFTPVARDYFIYEAQVTTGLGHSSNHSSTQRYRALGYLQFIDPTKAIMTLTHFEAGILNDVYYGDAHQLRSFWIFEQVEVNAERLAKLKLPVIFKYEKGAVTDLQFHKDDETAFENLKRGPLGLLHVNAAKLETTIVADELEMSVEGMCKTKFTKIMQQDMSFLYTKTPNFGTCLSRPQVFHSRLGETCGDWNYLLDQRRIYSSTFYVYNVSTSERIQLRNSYVRSTYSFQPFKPLKDAGLGETKIVATLKFYKTEEIATIESLPADMKKAEFLEYSIAWDTNKEEFQREKSTSNPFAMVKERVDSTVSLVKQIAQIADSEEQQHVFLVNELTEKLIKTVRMLSKLEIQAVVQKFGDSSATETSTLLNALALAGTSHSLSYLIQRLSTARTASTQLSLLINVFNNARAPTVEIANSLFQFCKTHIPMTSTQARGTCFKTFGALVRILIIDGSEQSKTATDTYGNNIKELLENAVKDKNEQEILLMISVASNAGLNNMAEPLMSIIKSDASSGLKMAAAEAFQQIISYFVVEENLHDVIANVSLATEVRIMAADTLLRRQPTRLYLTKLSMLLATDGVNDQLRSFIHSALREYQHVEAPCSEFNEYGKNIKHLWSQLFPRGTFPSNSVFYKMERYNDDLEIGWMAEWRQIFSETSPMPKALAFAFSTSLLNERTKNAVEIVIHFNGDNIDKDLAKVAQWLVQPELTRRVKRVRRETDTFRGFFDSISRLFFGSASSGTTSEAKTSSKVEVNLRFQNKDSFSWSIELDTLMKMFDDADNLRIDQTMERLFSAGVNYDIKTSTILYEVERKIPTSVGLPLHVSGNAPIRLAFHINANAKFEPPTGEKLESVAVTFDFGMRVTGMNAVIMEVWTPLVRSGIRIEHTLLVNLALNGTVKFDFDSKKTSATFDAPNDEKLIFSLDATSVVFTETSPTDPTTSSMRVLNLRPHVETLQERGNKWPQNDVIYLFFVETVQPGVDLWDLVTPAQTVALKNQIQVMLRAAETRPTSIGFMMDFEQTQILPVIGNVASQNDNNKKSPDLSEGWSSKMKIEVDATGSTADRALKIEMTLMCTKQCSTWQPIVKATVMYLDKNRISTKSPLELSLEGTGSIILDEAWLTPYEHTSNITITGDMTMRSGPTGTLRRVKLDFYGFWQRNSSAPSNGFFSLKVKDLDEMLQIWTMSQRFLHFTNLGWPMPVTAPRTDIRQLTLEVLQNGSIVLGAEIDGKYGKSELLGAPIMRTFLQPWKQCRLQLESVETFDRTTYTAFMLEKCYIPLFADCLSRSTMILAKKNSGGTLDLQLVTAFTTVAIEGNQLKCNNDLVEAKTGTVICGSAEIVLQESSKYIRAPFTQIRIDQQQIIVAISPVYRAKSCGLCAANTGEPGPDPFLFIDGSKTTSILQVFQAMTLTAKLDGTCTDETKNLLETHYKRLDENEMSVIEKSYSRTGNILMCVSAPYPMCPPESTASSTQETTIVYHCFNRLTFLNEPVSNARKTYMQIGRLESFDGEFGPPVSEIVDIPISCRRTNT